jgi:DNA-binding MarR family transcriptional regulator
VSAPETAAGPEAARLYVALGRLTRSLRKQVPDAAVGHGALSALATLLHEGPMRLGAIAEAESVSAPSMTRIVGLLEELGHVRRTPDQADRRAQIVELTDSGRELVLHGRAQRMVALSDRLAGLDPEARDALLRALPVLERLSEV